MTCFDPMLFQLLVEIGVGEAAVPPCSLTMRRLLRREVRIHSPPQVPLAKVCRFTRGDLAWVRVSPFSVITRLPTVVRHDEKLNFSSAHRRHDPAQMVEEMFFLGDLFEQEPKLQQPWLGKSL